MSDSDFEKDGGPLKAADSDKVVINIPRLASPLRGQSTANSQPHTSLEASPSCCCCYHRIHGKHPSKTFPASSIAALTPGCTSEPHAPDLATCLARTIKDTWHVPSFALQHLQHPSRNLSHDLCQAKFMVRLYPILELSA